MKRKIKLFIAGAAPLAITLVAVACGSSARLGVFLDALRLCHLSKRQDRRRRQGDEARRGEVVARPYRRRR
jgi:hypothetical protein